MREFGDRLSPDLEAEVRQAALDLFNRMPDKQTVLGDAVAMDETDMVVLEFAEVKDEEGNKFKLSQTRPEARPPFEWLMEISSDLGESEYFKHYLIRENDIVLAQRKVLTVIDHDEANIILGDLAEATKLIAS